MIMTDTPSFEIPATVRELAERNVDQARAAYAQFMDMARKAQEMVAQSSDAMAVGAREAQAKALGYAEANVDASFALAGDLARARDVKELMAIQQRHAQKQAQAYAQQAQELGRLLADAAKTAQRKAS
jgi:phasin